MISLGDQEGTPWAAGLSVCPGQGFLTGEMDKRASHLWAGSAWRAIGLATGRRPRSPPPGRTLSQGQGPGQCRLQGKEERQEV